MFSERLRTLRENSGKTQEEVSNALNIARGTYTHYELGKRKPDFDILIKLAGFFNVTTDYLLGRSDLPDSVNSKSAIHETKAYYGLDIAGLPEEAIKQVADYIELIKLKYNQDKATENK